MGWGLEEEEEEEAAMRRRGATQGQGHRNRTWWKTGETEQRVRTVGEEEKVVTGGDTACVSCPCLRQDKHKHINTLCSALCVPLTAHCYAQWWLPGSRLCAFACVCVCLSTALCVWECVFLEICSVLSGRKTTMSPHTSQDSKSLCLGRVLQRTHVAFRRRKPDIFTICVRHDNMMNVEFIESASMCCCLSSDSPL